MTNVFSNIVGKYSPLKKKFLRRNQAPFITKEFRKAMYNRKIPNEENEKLDKKQRNKCDGICKKKYSKVFQQKSKWELLLNPSYRIRVT